MRFLFYYWNLFLLTKQDAKKLLASITEAKSFFLLCPIRFYFRGDLIAAWAGAKITERSSLHLFYVIALNLIAFFQIRHGSEDLQRM